MRRTKATRDDRRANNECFSSSWNDVQIFPHADDSPSRGMRMARRPSSPRLPSPTGSMPANMNRNVLFTTMASMPSLTTSLPPSTTLTPPYTSSLSSSTLQPTLSSSPSKFASLPPRTALIQEPSSQGSTTFSAGTVIALSTVLPATILFLLGVIVYLLRTRGRPRSRPPKADPESLNNLPMTDIQRTSNPDLLPHRAISPFNLSLHDLVYGRNGSNTKPESIKSHVSSDSGHGRQTAPAILIPPTAITDQLQPPTPVLATRYTYPLRSAERTSIYVDQASVGSAAASTVVFAHPPLSHYGGTEEATSTGRPSVSAPPSARDLDSGFGRRSGELDEYRPSRELDDPVKGRDELVVSRAGASSVAASSETHATGGHARSGSKALKLLGFGPAPPTRAHLRSQSQPGSMSTTYGMPSLQLSPRLRALGSGGSKQPPGENIPHVPSPLGSQSPSQRIYSHRQSASLSTPISSARERQALSIIVPPRIGAPIRPVAELELEIGTPLSAPQPLAAGTPRGTPRTLRSPASGITIGSTGQLSDLGVLERTRSAFAGLARSEVAEPSPETRERILRLLGRLPEEPGSGTGSGSGGGDKSARSGESGEPERREVRRIRSEGGLLARPSSSEVATKYDS